MPAVGLQRLRMAGIEPLGPTSDSPGVGIVVEIAWDSVRAIDARADRHRMQIHTTVGEHTAAPPANAPNARRRFRIRDYREFGRDAAMAGRAF